MGVTEILYHYREGLLDGLGVTLKLCLIIWGVGISAGWVLGWAGARWHGPIGWTSRAFSFVLSGIPILVLLFWMHYPMQALLNVVIDPFITAAFTLTLVNLFSVADIVRGALRDFPAEYVTAAKVCGLSRAQTAIHIEAPLILRSALPSLVFLQVAMLQATLFASLISVNEIFRTAQRINAEIYRPVQVYTTLAIFFLAICLPLNGAALLLRQRFTRNLSDR
jgi:polar amino acid transport system permease protein